MLQIYLRATSLIVFLLLQLRSIYPMVSEISLELVLEVLSELELAFYLNKASEENK